MFNVNARMSDKETGQCTKELSTRLTSRIITAVIIVNVFYIGYGCVMKYVAPDNKSRRPFHLTEDEDSWRDSLVFLGCAIGSIPSGSVNDLLGRKFCLIITALLCTIGLTLEAAATNSGLMYTGLFLAGFAACINSSAVMIYIAEISPLNGRGKLLSVSTLSMCIGELAVNLAGEILPWNWLAIFVSAFYAFPSVLIVFLQESPQWFLLKGKTDAAKQSLEWLQGKSVAYIEEVQNVKEQQENLPEEISNWKILMSKKNMKSLLICSVLFTIQQFSGNQVLSIYKVDIGEIAHITTNKYASCIINELSSIAGGAICFAFIDCIDNRILLLLSMILMAISMAAFGTYFQCLKMFNDISSFQKSYFSCFPIICISLNNFAFHLGLWQIPRILSCELFSTNARGIAQSFLCSFSSILNFVTLKTFFKLDEYLHNTRCFAVYAAVSAFGIFFVALVIPDKTPKIME